MTCPLAGTTHDTTAAGCALCGCTNERACVGGCYLYLPDLCSRCAVFLRAMLEDTGPQVKRYLRVHEWAGAGGSSKPGAVRCADDHAKSAVLAAELGLRAARLLGLYRDDEASR